MTASITSRTMTIEQRQARAIQRAFQQRAHVLALRGRPGFYQVRSASDPSDRYTLSVHDGLIECSCKAAQFERPCWHVERLRNRLIREYGRNAA